MTLSSFSMTFQTWKMVFLNSMTFHDQGTSCPPYGGGRGREHNNEMSTQGIHSKQQDVHCSILNRLQYVHVSISS